MSIRKPLSATTLAMSVALVLGGCGEAEPQDKNGLDDAEQQSTVFNGQSWNGQSWNGQSWNGQSWNGQSWNGQSWNGQSWNGQSWNGQSWNGLGWNGVGGAGSAFNGIGWNNATSTWSGNAWGGAGPLQTDCQPTTNNNSCTTVHNWVNHLDANGNGVVGYPSDANDIQIQVSNLGAWVSCACPANVAIPFSDTHGLVPATTFYGGLGLAPTWCGSNASAVVPTSEIQIVSACLIAKVNMKGKHFPLSMRSQEAGTAVSINESFLSIEPAAMYWGNLWSSPHADYDKTTCNWQNPSDPTYPGYPSDPGCTNPKDQGGAWLNMERFSCTGFGAATNLTLKDQVVFGRDCEVSSCGDHLEYLGSCLGGSKNLSGAGGIWHPVDGVSYPETLPDGNSNTPGGLTINTGANLGGGTTTTSVSYRGNTWRALSVFTPFSIPLEDPLPTTTYNGGIYPNLFSLSLPWAQQEFGTNIPASQSANCAGGQAECQGTSVDYTNYYRKLLGLKSAQWVSVNLTGYHPGGNSFTADGTTAVTVAIRYQRQGVLGDHQCDTDAGCQATTASECASGSQYADGSCVGNSGAQGTASPGQLEVFVMGKQAASTSWDLVHGNTAPYGKNIFPPTGTGAAYNTAYIYPVYIQNSYNTIAGVPSQKPVNNSSADTLRVMLSGSTANVADAPQIDTAYFFAGTPTPDMNCTGKSGCWLYAGPNQSISLSAGQTVYPNLGQGTSGFNITPTLPPGTYTFALKGVHGDLDLYVKANNLVDTGSNWDCRPYLAANHDESCTMTLTTPGYFSILVKGYANNGSSPATAVLNGHN